MREAHALDRRLGHAANDRRRLDAERVEHGRHHVDRMRVLMPDLALGLDPLRPVHEERIGHAAAKGLALPALERRVAGEGPAPGVVVEVFRPAEVVERREVLLQIVRHVVEELVLVGRAGRAAFRAGAVVGDEHDQRVVELAGRGEEVDQPADVMIGVLEEAGEHFHHAGVEPPLVGGQLAPVLHVGVVTRQHGVLRDDAELFLLGEHLLTIGVPAVVELALVLVGPLLRDVMRRMLGAGREVDEERLVWRELLAVADEADRLVHQVGREVIALLRRLRRFDLAVVVDEIGVVLAGVAAEEAIVALEAAPQRPAVVGPGGTDLLGGRQMPFPERVGVVALPEQNLGQEAILERDRAVGAGIALRAFGDARHRVGMMIAPGQDAGARSASTARWCACWCRAGRSGRAC